jgi:hypothetical protein
LMMWRRPPAGDDFQRTDQTFRLGEYGSFADLLLPFGRAILQGGIRMDGAGGTAVLQPRARLSVPVAKHLNFGVAAGRTARLYHVVSDPQSEPDLAFYDFWLNAGENGIPVPTVDHATVDIEISGGRIASRVGLFTSSGRGLVELRPNTDQQDASVDQFRTGRSRTAGLETQVSVAGGAAWAAAVTYVLSISERNWGSEWIPWVQDRRHLLRVAARKALGAHFSLSGTFEGVSGPPLTPVEAALIVGSPGPTGPANWRNFFQRAAYIYGAENSHRSAGMARADLSLTYRFRGPGTSTVWCGLSVINAGFGQVAPLRPAAPDFIPGSVPLTGRVRYERLIEIPAVPTLTVHAEF